MTNPFLAVFLGLAIGFAIVVPFGGLKASNTKASRTIACDIMGCKQVLPR